MLPPTFSANDEVESKMAGGSDAGVPLPGPAPGCHVITTFASFAQGAVMKYSSCGLSCVHHAGIINRVRLKSGYRVAFVSKFEPLLLNYADDSCRNMYFAQLFALEPSFDARSHAHMCSCA